MILINENSEAKKSALNDMLDDSRKSSDKHRKMKSNLQDALNTANVHRIVVGDDFVDDDNTIKTIIKERY